MKQLLIKTFLIMLPVIMAIFATEILVRNIPNEYSYKCRYLDKNSEKIETLILGSSHSYFGIDPVFISGSAFNVANVSQSLKYDFEILRKYQNNIGELKIIVLPIDYFSFWSDLADGSESWRVKNYVLYFDMKSNRLKDYSEFLSNDLMNNIRRMGGYYILKRSISCSDLGWGTTFHSSKSGDLTETGKTAAKRHTQDDIFSARYQKIYDENIVNLNSLADFCNQRNVKLVLITMPTYYTYRENLNKIQLDKMYETIDNFLETHKYVVYLNYFDDTDFVAQDFFDADHLNEIGAEKFSKKLQKDMDALR
jgi:hypothetical protein